MNTFPNTDWFFYFHRVSQDSVRESQREESEFEFTLYEIINMDIQTTGCLHHSQYFYSHQTAATAGSNNQVVLFINAAQALSLKEPCRMKTRPMTEDIDLPLSCVLPLSSTPLTPAGEYWHSVKDSSATAGLSYLQAQRRRLRRDSDSEAVSAIASLSMGALMPGG